jgi:GT2 family glycosyltransferase
MKNLNCPFTVVIVSYHSNLKIFDLYKTIPKNISIIIVDNSNDIELANWSQDKSNVNFIGLPKNIGFGAACNIGASYCSTEWIFFVNPDCLFDENTVLGFSEFINLQPSAKCFSPLITDENNKVFYKNKCFLSKPSKIFIDTSKTTKVPFLSGAALFVEKNAFESIGGFDENIFLFFEDDDLTFRLHVKFGSNYITPLIKITHFGGQSSPNSSTINLLKKYHWGKSEMYVTKKYKGNFSGFNLFLIHFIKLLNPLYLFKRSKFSLQAYKLLGIAGIKINF